MLFIANGRMRWEAPGMPKKSTEALFKSMVKKGLPAPVQQKLEQVVGLSKMDWPLFVEHIVHHVNYHRKEAECVRHFLLLCDQSRGVRPNTLNGS